MSLNTLRTLLGEFALQYYTSFHAFCEFRKLYNTLVFRKKSVFLSQILSCFLEKVALYLGAKPPLYESTNELLQTPVQITNRNVKKLEVWNSFV